MIVKYIEPNDDIFKTIKSIIRRSDELVLFSVDDVAELTMKTTEDIRERFTSLLSSEVIIDNRDNFSQEFQSSDRVFTLMQHSLTLGKEYLVLGIEADSYRVINDKGQPVLFEPQCFEIVNSTRPDFWITEVGEDGEEYSYPKEWKSVGFWEDYFDRVNEAIDVFEKVMHEKYW